MKPFVKFNLVEHQCNTEMKMSTFLIHWEERNMNISHFSNTSLRFLINFVNGGRNIKNKLKMCVDISGIHSEIIDSSYFP